MRRSHRSLNAWKQAMALVVAVYSVTEKFPQTEQYGLTSQLRRAAVSVPANIAEGATRTGSKEFLHFLSIASGSLSELDTLIDLAIQLGYIEDTEELSTKVDDVAGLIMGLASSIRRKL